MHTISRNQQSLKMGSPDAYNVIKHISPRLLSGPIDLASLNCPATERRSELSAYE